MNRTPLRPMNADSVRRFYDQVFVKEPGDCTVHHPLTVHGSEGNFSPSQRRKSISTRYMGANVRCDPRPATIKVTGNPQLNAGAPPDDDRCFPVAWRRDAN